ncbi:hypothetical protein LCGC14_0446910 [marine sediment metagenome]|uniref:Uncharacterized protein n=1 Tax=marine sediment metagenome TaxID=412755 RepID=A0A0F9SIX8_9ZZZZ
MKPGRGKSKGNRFENFIGRQLSKWLTYGEDAKQLIPTRLSGGWAAGEEWRQAGDLAPNGPEGEKFRRRFIVECKHRKGDLLWELYTMKPAQNIRGWWRKLEAEAAKLSNTFIPLLICRQNVRPVLAIMPTWLAEALWAYRPTLGRLITYRDETMGFGIIRLDLLLEYYTPDELFDRLPSVPDMFDVT